jgi:HD superfamily phosphohydrolase
MARLWTSLALAPPPRRGYGRLVKHRDARVAIEREQDVAALLHDVGLNPFGWLVENPQPCLEHQRTRNRERLLAAREITSAAVTRLVQQWRQVIDVRRNRAVSTQTAQAAGRTKR